MHSEFWWAISWKEKVCKDSRGDEEYKMDLKNIARELLNYLTIWFVVMLYGENNYVSVDSETLRNLCLSLSFWFCIIL
jgi:hypothetical protein